MKKALFLGLAVVFLAACAENMRGEFEKTLSAYGELIRLNKMELAGAFTTESRLGEVSARVEAAKNARVVDYRVGGVKFDEKKAEAEARVEIDYYTLSAYRLKTLVDVQKWVYVDEDGKKQWRLKSLLPEFK